MDIRISAANCEIDQKLKNYIDKKMRRIEGHFRNLIDAHVILKKQKQGYIAEIVMMGDHKRFYYTAEAKEIKSAFDLLIDKTENQISRFEGRKHQHRIKRTALKYASGPIPQLEATNVKDYNVKPMSFVEAILQLDLVESDFLIFPEIDMLSFNIVFKDASGLYGIIRKASGPMKLLDRILRKKESGFYIRMELVYLKNNEIKRVESKRMPVEELDVDKAVLNLNNSSSSFYVFADRQTLKMSVVYKRDRNNFGLIEQA